MRYILPIGFGLLMMGCLPKPQTPPAKRPKIPYMEDGPPSMPLSDGSLWQDRRVVSDLRANRLNDLVTIRITESTSAVSKADVTTGKNGTSNMDTGAAGDKSAGDKPGGERGAGDKGAGDKGAPPKAASVSSKFTGSGTTGRSAVFTTTITARVVKVLGNGNLIFEGLRDIQLNNETQRLYVAGMLDPARLDGVNSISSSLVAELRVGYGGQGIVDENLKPGYISRILNYIWPF